MAEEREVVLMKGNEAIAHAAIRCGCDGYFGYPITPQSEVIETLAELKPWETTGMQVVQAESELASIYMVYGAAGAGKRAMTSSSSPGIALMQEGIMSIESVMPSNHLILCCPLLLLPSIFPSIRVFSNESAVCIR